METRLSSAAYSDIVLLMSELPESLTPISIAELHLYCYLSNLLALARGMPLADWGYRFAITSEGFPRSEALDNALSRLRAQGLVEVRSGNIEKLDPQFSVEADLLLSLTQSLRRKEWLKTASRCALSFPKGAIRLAINNSAGFDVHLQQGRVTSLLYESDREDLYDEFALIHKILGETGTDQIQPAIIWLSAKVMEEK